MARPRIELDISRIEELAAQGLSQAEICLCIGISESTLYRRKTDMEVLTEAIKSGRAKAASAIANTLYLMARGGDLGAIVWWEKTRRGLSEKTTHVFANDIDWAKVTDEVLDAYRAGKLSLDDVRRSITSV